MAHIERLTVFPVKALDGIDRAAVSVRPGGSIAADREFALLDADGAVVNGKRTARVHDVDTTFDPHTGTLTVSTADRGPAAFALRDPVERERAADWLGAAFDLSISIVRDAESGFPDRPALGPSVVSTATIEAVASWFPALSPAGTRRRLRANVEVGGVPAFWEDRLLGDGAPVLAAGAVRLAGATPCGRCVVPERDPETGERTPGFRERFVERRRETLPEWVDEAAFDHFYAAMVISRTEAGGELAVGSDVTLVGDRTDT